MKELVLAQVKQQLTAVIDIMTLENLNDSMEKLQTYFGFLENLKSLPTIVDSLQPTPAPTPVVQAPVPVPEPVQVKEEPVIQEEPVYEFQRKLRGGFIEYRGGYPLPEKLVRDMGVEHGDKVKVIDTVYINGQPRARFEIVEKANIGDPKERVQLDFCIIEEGKYGLGYEVSEYTNGRIIVDGHPFTFKIPQKEVLDFNLKKGDLIDIAFYESNPDGLRVIWKHDTFEMPNMVVVPKQAPPKKSPANVEIDFDDEDTKYPIDLSLFKDKNLVIVGSEYDKAKYQKACELLGIKLTHMSGDEGKVRLRTAIKKADVVVLTIHHVGHKGSIPTADLCKEYNVPLASVDRSGVQYMLLEAERVMKRKIEQTA